MKDSSGGTLPNDFNTKVILGMVELEYKEGESKGEFRRMSISEDARRLGLARKFVLNLNDFAKIEGYKEVFQKIQRRRV